MQSFVYFYGLNFKAKRGKFTVSLKSSLRRCDNFPIDVKILFYIFSCNTYHLTSNLF